MSVTIDMWPHRKRQGKIKNFLALSACGHSNQCCDLSLLDNLGHSGRKKEEPVTVYYQISVTDNL